MTLGEFYYSLISGFAARNGTENAASRGKCISSLFAAGTGAPDIAV